MSRSRKSDGDNQFAAGAQQLSMASVILSVIVDLVRKLEVRFIFANVSISVKIFVIILAKFRIIFLCIYFVAHGTRNSARSVPPSLPTVA